MSKRIVSNFIRPLMTAVKAYLPQLIMPIVVATIVLTVYCLNCYMPVISGPVTNGTLDVAMSYPH